MDISPTVSVIHYYQICKILHEVRAIGDRNEIRRWKYCQCHQMVSDLICHLVLHLQC